MSDPRTNQVLRERQLRRHLNQVEQAATRIRTRTSDFVTGDLADKIINRVERMRGELDEFMDEYRAAVYD